MSKIRGSCQELYAVDIANFEQDGTQVNGKEAVMAKTAGFGDMIEEFRSSKAVRTYADSESFIIVFDNDFTLKDGVAVVGEELGYYKVADGKIIEERFYGQTL